MRAATASKAANTIGIRNFARPTFSDDQIFARHRSPRDVRGARAAPAIDAMTIDQSKRLGLQHVPCLAANASTDELHKIRLAQFNHEFTRMNTNYHCSGGRVGCASFYPCAFKLLCPLRAAPN